MSTSVHALPCLVCRKGLIAIEASPDGEHPQDGVAFTTRGNYGSAVYDDAAGRQMHVNICDPCLEAAIAAGVTRESAVRPPGQGLDEEARRLLEEAEVIASWDDPRLATR